MPNKDVYSRVLRDRSDFFSIYRAQSNLDDVDAWTSEKAESPKKDFKFLSENKNFLQQGARPTYIKLCYAKIKLISRFGCIVFIAPTY